MIVAMTVLIRIRFLDFPLERDEGEYAFMGSLILQGIAPYAESYNMKMPGIYLVYALIMEIFGESVHGIRTGLILFSLASTALVFLISRQWLGQAGAWIAAALYSVVALLPGIQGVSANAEQFVLPFALAGVWLVISRSGSIPASVAAGILMGAAMTIKQHGALFTVFAGIYYLLIIDFPVRRRIVLTILFGCGCLVPLLTTLLVMYMAGVFNSFIFWTFEYAMAYASQVPPAEGLKILVLRLVTLAAEAPLVWITFAAGLVLAVRERTAAFAPVALLGASLLATVPGFFFRPHYFILLMPAVCLLCTALLQRAGHRFGEPAAAAALAVIVALTILPARQVLLILPMDDVSRAIYGANPFAESDEIAAYINANTSSTDRIAVIGSEPQIYFLSGRRAATGYIYTYALMEDQPFSERMQTEMIREIEAAAPLMIAYINVPNSWLVRPESSRTIFKWYSGYQQEHYRLVGQVRLGPGGATYYWEDELPELVDPRHMGVYVFRREDH